MLSAIIWVKNATKASYTCIYRIYINFSINYAAKYKVTKVTKELIRCPSVMFLFSGMCNGKKDGFPSLFHGVHQTPPRDEYHIHTCIYTDKWTAF
jgi:hypothetical protein